MFLFSNFFSEALVDEYDYSYGYEDDSENEVEPIEVTPRST